MEKYFYKKSNRDDCVKKDIKNKNNIDEIISNKKTKYPFKYINIKLIKNNLRL